MSCQVCGVVVPRYNANQKYCRPCRRSQNARVERGRHARKLGSPATHSRRDFVRLCQERGWRCAYCDKALTPKTATEDHVVPLSRGGSDGIENIAPACISCNASKRATPAAEFRARLAVA
jgi:5-methylcytosine-specific restriction endonuclease McrA